MAVIDNLIFSLEMDEASGSAVDAHTNALTFTDNNTVGASGGWRDFEADNIEYFSRTSESLLQTGEIDFTFETSVQLESKTVTDKMILRKWTASNFEVILVYSLSDDRFLWIVRNDNGASNITVLANNLGSPSTGVPYHIVVWHQFGTGIGIKVNDGTANTTSSARGPIVGTAPVYIGFSDTESVYYDGLMRRVRFWKRMLTNTEHTWLYNSGTTRSYADIVAEAGGSLAYVTPNTLRPAIFSPGIAR